jgi:uncharacterized OsmC-like protein
MSLPPLAVSTPAMTPMLSIALGACTAIMLRLYAEHKKRALGSASVAIAGKCPVSRTLEQGAAVVTRVTAE